MKNIIIGTAGHVDHGKTQLIKALSGIDTDRLSEEKKRGITIELGFAHIPNDDGYNIGVIDVPGHEKFIKNMLSGIGGIDFVLFVVAADEGIMPQTKEHFEILQSLGIDDGIIAVTKTDMVDDEWMEMLLEDVQDYFKGSFLEGKPMIPVSSKTGYNIDVLKAEIIKKCDRNTKRIEAPELFRLPIDRVFTMAGFGTVVTGTLIDGKVSVNDEVIIYPEGIKAKIRGIQSYGQDVESAIAGQRTAINLNNVKKEDIARGDVLAAPGAVNVANMLDVTLKEFSSSDRVILNNSRVHIYSGSKEALCKVILMDRDSLQAGETCYAQLRLEEPMAIRRGDKFIVRFYSPMITIGGGTVLDATPEKHKRNKPDILKAFEILDEGTLADVIGVKAGSRSFYTAEELTYQLGVTRQEMNEILATEIENEHIAKLDNGIIVAAGKMDRLKGVLMNHMAEYHAENPLADGVPKQELTSKLVNLWHIEDDKLVASIVRFFLDKGDVEDRGTAICEAGFRPVFTPEQEALKAKIAGMYKSAGMEMPKNDDFYALDGDKRVINAIFDSLISEGVIVKVDPANNIDADSWNKIVQAARELGAGGPFVLADFRDKLDTSRKYASAFLQALDRKGITRFDGEKRSVV